MIDNIKKYYFLIIITFLIIYFFFNLLEGNRGLISYFEKKEIYKKLDADKKDLSDKIVILEQKNSLLTDNIDLDFIEILIREKFLFGKKDEKLFLIKNNEN